MTSVQNDLMFSLRNVPPIRVNKDKSAVHAQGIFFCIVKTLCSLRNISLSNYLKVKLSYELA